MREEGARDFRGSESVVRKCRRYGVVRPSPSKQVVFDFCIDGDDHGESGSRSPSTLFVLAHILREIVSAS